MVGPSGLVRKAVMGTAAGLSEGAGEIAQKIAPEWEPAARFAGAIAGGSVASGSRAGAENAILADIQKTTPDLMAAKNSAYENAANTLGRQQMPMEDFVGLVRQTNKLASDGGIGDVADVSSKAKYSGSMPIVDEMTNALRGAAKDEAPTPTFADLETWRQNLNNVVDRSIGNDGRMGADGYFAKSIIKKLTASLITRPILTHGKPW